MDVIYFVEYMHLIVKDKEKCFIKLPYSNYIIF